MTELEIIKVLTGLRQSIAESSYDNKDLIKMIDLQLEKLLGGL